jgi:hypothetical protein
MDRPSFDAAVCLYLLIHLPLDEQPPLLAVLVSRGKIRECDLTR